MFKQFKREKEEIKKKPKQNKIKRETEVEENKEEESLLDNVETRITWL